MDPLSVTSAVVGLLTATGKVYALLEGLSAIRNAPATIKDAQKEVRHAEIALCSMQRLLQRLDASNLRRGLIQVDELRITLADAMLAFSAFETMLKRLAGLARVRVAISWIKFSKQIDEHVARIGRYQQSLTLMMSILQCDSDLEASQSQEKLQSLIQRVLAENTELRQKLVDSKDSFAARSIATRHPEDEHGTIREQENGNDDASTIRGIGRTHSVRSTISNFGGAIIKFAFEDILEQSRVYRKNANQIECDRSLASTAQRSHAWSVFSGYSLADISVLSVIAMPLTTLDLANGKYYLIHPKDESLMGPEDGMGVAVNNLDHGVSPNPTDSKSLQGNATPMDTQPAQLVLSEIGQNDAATQYTPLDWPALGALKTEATTIAVPIKDDELHQDAVEDPTTVLIGLESSHASPDSTSPLTPVSEPPLSSLSLASDDFSVIDDIESVHEHDHDATDLSDDDYGLFPCKGCGEILEEGKAFELAGERWHLNCFRCATCDTPLDSDSNLLLQGDGSLICNNCLYDCAACGIKIEDLAILTGDQAFCANCFRCRNCKLRIENLRYARTSQGMFCIQCHEMLINRRRRKMMVNKKIAPVLEDTKYGPEGVDEAEESSRDGPSWMPDIPRVRG